VDGYGQFVDVPGKLAVKGVVRATSTL
jgi:hypothetical protein